MRSRNCLHINAAGDAEPYAGMIGNLLLMGYGIPAGKEFKMIVTGVIVAGIVLYAIWAVRKVRRNHRNGSCCGGSCPGCTGKGYCSK